MKTSSSIRFDSKIEENLSIFLGNFLIFYRYQVEQSAQPMMIMTLMMDEFGQQQQQPMIMF